MVNKKSLTIFVVAAVLTLTSSVKASSNDLLKMDVKRSSLDDAIDVTFYTTGGATNSVVTRKDNNRYVVLLPNVSGSSSTTPNIAGIKDLVTDVNVKNVDDGIGGYTKVTFTATKPLKITTSTKYTPPLTNAQKEYKSLIAQNNKKPATARPQAKVVGNVNNTVKPVVKNEIKPAVALAKKNENKISKQEQKVQNIKPVNNVKTVSSEKNVKVAIKKEDSQNAAQKVEKKQSVQGVQDNKVVEEQKVVKTNVETNTQPKVEAKKSDTFVVDNSKNKSHKNISAFSIIGIMSIAALFLIFMFINFIVKASNKKSDKFKELLENGDLSYSANSKEYEKIINDKNSSWQEKYKKLNELEKSKDTKKSQYSYLASVKSKKELGSNIPSLKSKEVKMQEVISQMEHSLAQPSSVNESNIVDNSGLKSEDDSIAGSMSKVKLKSFSKHKNLDASSRSLLGSEKKDSKIPVKMRESQFVKLRNSALSISKRKSFSGNYGFSISDLVRTGNKYMGEVEMGKTIENYSSSSLDEYLSILDDEGVKSTSSANNLKQNVVSPKVSSPRSGMTNPIENAKHSPLASNSSTQDLNGLIVKSGYNIDDNRGFYLVNLDGSSALVGKVNDDIFVLKRFNKIIDEQLQVRLDYGSVYIVKAGGFKCLVEVSENKMGTLLEI